MAGDSDAPTPNESPRGPQEVREALIAAAMRLLPAKGPDGVTGRDIARLAGVNYGLIHHYFGGKQALLHEALVRLREEFIERRRSSGPLELVLDEQDPFLRAIVWSSLTRPAENRPARDGLTASMQLEQIRELLPPSTPEASLKARAMLLLAIQLGLSLNRTMFYDVFRVDEHDVDDVESELQNIYAQIASGPAGR
jgi:AcrR family transcriptional regulator